MVACFAAAPPPPAPRSIREEFLIQTWDEDKGLAYPCVSSMTQTPEGYIWFATFASVVRFDGVRFKDFDSEVTAALPDRVSLVCTDRAGALWAGMPAGMARFKDGHWQFFGQEAGWPGDWPRTATEDAQGNLFVSAGLKLVRFAGDRFVPFTPPDRGEDADRLLGIYADRDGVLWVRGDRYLGYREKGQWVAVLTPKGEESTDWLMGIARARDGGMWVADMLRIRRFKNGQWDRTFARPEGFKEDATYLFEDSQGNLWVGGYRHGVVMFKPDGSALRCATQDGLLNNATLAILEDHERCIWVGSNGGGVARLRPRVFKTYGEEAGLSQPVVNCVSEAAPGEMWVGTHGGSVVRLEERRGACGPELKLAPPGGGGAWVHTLAQDGSGALWVGAFRDGLFRVADGRAEAVRFSADPESSVGAMLLDSQGGLWFGSGEGVWCRRGGGFTHFGAAAGLRGITATAIAEDCEGRIWVADGGKPAALFRRQGERFEPFAWPASSRLAGVNTLCRGRDSLWLGADDGTLRRLRGDDCVEFGPREGLPEMGIVAVLEDDIGDVWLGTDRGIVRVTKDSLQRVQAGQQPRLEAVVFSRADGLRASRCRELMQPNCCKASDGRLWFATVNGLAVVDPRRVVAPPQCFPVLIEEVVLDDEVVRSVGGATTQTPEMLPSNQPPPEAGDRSRLTAGQDGVLRVPPHVERLAIRYTALTFGEAERVRFRFRIEGLDDEWTEAETRRVAQYSHLPPGRYRFRVAAQNAAGIRNDEGATLDFIVVPHWWATLWFRGVAGAAVAGLLVWFFRQRFRRLEQARAAQEQFSYRLFTAQEEERKRIAAELHDGLGQNLGLVKNRALLGLAAASDAAALTEHLSQISTLSSLALEDVRKMVRNLRPAQLDHVGLTKSLDLMLDCVADSTQTRFVRELEPVDGVLPPAFEASLYRVVQEGVNNVVRHARATTAEVELGQRAGGLRLVIRDDGCGFDPAEVAAQAASGRGMGLSSLAERARMMGGRLEVQSRRGEGTTLVLTVPLPCRARAPDS